MKAIELSIPDAVYGRLSVLAAHDRQAVEEFALHKLEEAVRAVEHFAELEHRARRGSLDKFRAVMAKVPDVPSLPGDELPTQPPRS